MKDVLFLYKWLTKTDLQDSFFSTYPKISMIFRKAGIEHTCLKVSSMELAKLEFGVILDKLLTSLSYSFPSVQRGDNKIHSSDIKKD